MANQVQPVADTMGNDAAQSAVDEWVRSNQGGPENPDDPDDMWFWQHKNIADVDFASKAELSRKGGGENKTDDGSVRTAYDLRSEAEHTKLMDKTTTTVIGNGGLEYERTRETEAVSSNDRFSASMGSKRVSVTTDDGLVSRTSEGDIELSGQHTNTIRDGDDTVTNSWAHDGRAYGSGTRTGDERTASTLDGSAGTRWTRTAVTGPEHDRTHSNVSANGTVSAKQNGVGDDRAGTLTATVGGAASGDRTVRHADGSKTVRQGNIDGTATGTRTTKPGEQATYTGSTSARGNGSITHTNTREDGADVVRTAGASGGFTGNAGKSAKGKGDLELTAERDITHTLADGSRTVHIGGVAKGNVDVKRVEDGYDRTSSMSVGADGSNSRTTNTDDGSLTHTLKGRANVTRDAVSKADGTTTSKTATDVRGDWSRAKTTATETGNDTTTMSVGGEGRGSTAVNAEGVRTNSVGASVRGQAKREINDTFEDGSKRQRSLTGTGRLGADGTQTGDKRSGTGTASVVFNGTDLRTSATGDTVADTVGGGVTATGGLNDTTRSVDGHVDMGRDTTTKLEYGKLKTHVGGGLTGNRTSTAVGEDGRRVTQTTGARADASRTRTTDIDDGSIDRTLRGKANVDRTTVTNPDGTKTASTTGKASIDQDYAKRTRTEDSQRTQTASVGADVRGGSSTDKDDVRTHTAGTTLRGAIKDHTMTTLEDGSTVDRTWTGNGGVGGDVERTGDTTTRRGNASLSGGLKTVHTATDDGVKTVTVTDLNARTNVDGKHDKTGKGTANIQAGRSIRTSQDKDGHKLDTETNGKIGVGGSLERTEKGWKNVQNITAQAGHTVRDITSDETGVMTRQTAYTAKGTAGRTGSTGQKEQDNKASLDLSRNATTEHQHTVDGTSTLTKTGNKTTLGANYATKTGFGLMGSNNWSSSTEVTDEDGNMHESSKALDVSAGYNQKDGLSTTVAGNMVRDRQTTKLSDTVTRTTTRGEGKASATAGIKKDKDGNRQAHASAKASATAFSDNVAYNNGKGLKASAGYEVGTAEANAKGTAALTADGVKVRGSAGAKVTLVGGNARAEVPAFTWNLLGEPVRVKITAALSASVLAEAQGEIELDVSKGENLGVTVGGGGSAFAGAKAGVEVGAHIQWMRNQDYTALLMDFLDDIPGIGWAVDDVPKDLWTQISSVLIGTGTSDLLIGKAGVHGSAGIGGEASFGLALQGGRVKMNGNLNGAIGLGAGAKTSLDLDAVDGVRFGGVLAMRGVEWIKKHIGGAASWTDQAIDECRTRIDAYLEEKKAEGGWSGMWSSAVDWVGDDLFDLW